MTLDPDKVAMAVLKAQDRQTVVLKQLLAELRTLNRYVGKINGISPFERVTGDDIPADQMMQDIIGPENPY